MILIRQVIVVTVGIVPLLLTGCGSGQVSNRQLVAAREEGRSQAAAEQKVETEKRRLEQAVTDLQEHQRQLEVKVLAAQASPTATPSAAVPAAAAAAGLQDCGGGVSVNAVTSCSFGLIVAQQWRLVGGGTVEVDAWSPVTQQVYAMHCVAGLPAVCRGGNDAVVRIR